MNPRADADDDTEEKENSARERWLRLLTWNVNRAEPSGAAFDAVIAHVRSLTPPPHVIALQLASKDFALALASGLGWSDSLYHSTPGSGWGSEPHGNAVLTDFRAGALVVDTMDLQLPGAPPRSVMCVQVMIPECKKEQEEEEAAMGVDSKKTNQRPRRSNRRNLAPEQEAVWVCSIHLDNTREDVRMKQAREAARRLRICGPHVLCGDFNALLSRDFTPEEWKQLSGLAADNGWEPRQDRVMRYLLGKRRNTHSSRGVTPRADAQGRTRRDAKTSSRAPSGEKESEEQVDDDDEGKYSCDDDVNGNSGVGGLGGRDASVPDEKETGHVWGVHYGQEVTGGAGRSAGEVGAGYDDAWEAAGTAVTGRLHTFRLPSVAGNMRVRLDYVLLSDSLAGSAAAAETAEVEGASNHCAVTVDLRLH